MDNALIGDLKSAAQSVIAAVESVEFRANVSGETDAEALAIMAAMKADMELALTRLGTL